LKVSHVSVSEYWWANSDKTLEEPKRFSCIVR